MMEMTDNFLQKMAFIEVGVNESLKAHSAELYASLAEEGVKLLVLRQSWREGASMLAVRIQGGSENGKELSISRKFLFEK